MRPFFVRVASAFAAQPIWIFIIGIALILTLTGPFGTYERLNVWGRVAYWIPVVLVVYMVVKLSHKLVDRVLPKASVLQWQLAAVVTFSTIFTPLVWSYSKLFSDQFDSLESLFLMAGNVFGVALIFRFVLFFLLQLRPAEAARAPRLYQRLENGPETPVSRLTVDDHYVEVHLQDGSSHRLLMRLADAVSEMDETPGFYTHRSHWVAADQVVEAYREKQREFLRLRDGAAVPVSRTYRGAVQAAGFL